MRRSVQFRPGPPDVDLRLGPSFLVRTVRNSFNPQARGRQARPENLGAAHAGFACAGLESPSRTNYRRAAESSRPGEKILASACPGGI